MSEWSGYFKRAVQSLDQTLEQAMNSGNASKEPSEDVEDPAPITVSTKLEEAPSFDQIRQLASDDVRLLQEIEDLEKAIHEFVTERMQSVSTKLKYLSLENARLNEGLGPAPGAATAKKIDLLMEEGQRLSQQELKLNTVIRKLRIERNELKKEVESVHSLASTSSDSEERKSTKLQKDLEDTHTQLKSLRGQCQSLEQQLSDQTARAERQTALAEHFRGLSAASTNKQAFEHSEELQHKLDHLERDQEAAREQWLQTEQRLQSTIAELEAALKVRDSRAKDSQSRIVELQAELQSVRTKYSESDSALKEVRAHSDRLQETLAELKSQYDAVCKQASGFEEELLALNRAKAAPSPSPVPPVVEQVPTLEFTEPPPLEPLEPSEPVASASVLDSLGSPPLSRSASNASVHSESQEATSTHLITKLNYTVRKLENELLSCREMLESARKEKNEAYDEMAKFMTVGDEVEKLRNDNEVKAARIKELEDRLDPVLVKLGQKSEEVQELRADVEDLKDMYKEQVQALVSEIENLKSR